MDSPSGFLQATADGIAQVAVGTQGTLATTFFMDGMQTEIGLIETDYVVTEMGNTVQTESGKGLFMSSTFIPTAFC